MLVTGPYPPTKDSPRLPGLRFSALPYGLVGAHPRPLR